MDSLGAVLPLLFGVSVVAVVAFRLVADRKRRDALLRYVVARGWTLVGEDPSLCFRWVGTPFGDGDNPRAKNVVTGTAGERQFTAFDYSYETHSTDTKGHRTTSTHRFEVVVVGLPTFLGQIEVLPENVLTRVAGAVGLERDVALESEDFNRRYRVRAVDRKLASDVLPPRTMEYLLSVPAPAWRIEGRDAVLWRSGRLDPLDVVAFTGIVDRVLDGIPAFVWKDRGYDPRS